MLLTVKHTTEYSYEAPVDFVLQKVRLRPMTSNVQVVNEWSVDVEGGKIETRYKDHFGNHVDLVSADPGAQKMVIVARGEVETGDPNGVFGRVYGRAPLWLFRQSTELTEGDAAIAELARIIGREATVLDGLHALSKDVITAVPYEIGSTEADTTAAQALEIGKGVCQDHAHIFTAAARAAGLPARYVSGYLMMNDRVDQAASHAWAEVHTDDLGWVGFDVSNGVSPDERYIRIAVGRDAHDAAPINGLRAGTGDESMIVTLQVQQ